MEVIEGEDGLNDVQAVQQQVAVLVQQKSLLIHAELPDAGLAQVADSVEFAGYVLYRDGAGDLSDHDRYDQFGLVDRA